MPDPAQWPRIEALYYDALELPEAARAAYLAQVCMGDEDVRREVASLLAARSEAQHFLAPVTATSGFPEQRMAVLPGPTAQIGETLQQYQILAALGAGGMGEVYLAEDKRLQRKVALKLLPTQFVHDAARARRFEQEARAVSALNHPNILTLFDLGQAGECYFMATEFIDGRTLRAHLRERPRWSITEAVSVILQCASALQSAHAAGIVHRDIKPENIMLRHDGYVKVLDFGLAKVHEQPTSDEQNSCANLSDENIEGKNSSLTAAGMLLGTVSYMSPEQARGLRVDARTDVFSLGIVLYEMLLGERPFTGATTSDIIAAILRAEPPPLRECAPELPAELQPILQRALAKERDARYQQISEFAQDLKQLTDELAFQARLADSGKRQSSATSLAVPAPLPVPPTATPESAIPALPAPRLRFPLWKRVALASALLLMLASAWSVWRARQTVVPPSADSNHTSVRTLAVLPFKLFGGAAEDQYLGLGLADALIGKLSNLRQLTVRPTSAVLKYREGEVDVGQASQTLKVDAVLTGNVQKVNDHLRVTVQLVKTPTPGAVAQAVWSDVFSTATGDLFELQDRLAAQLVQRLALRLTGDEQRQLGKRYTENQQAYQLYLQGRFFASQRTTEGYRRALELYAQALTQDAQYAPAYVGQANCWQLLIEHNAVLLSEALAKSKAAVRQALLLDDTLAEAHAYHSHLVRVWDWNQAEANRASDRSMELEPNNPQVLQWRGVHLLARGRTDEAVALHLRAVEINPLDLMLRSQLCRALYLAHRYEEAISVARTLLQLDGNQSAAHQYCGQSYAELGRFAEAFAELQQAVALAPTNGERLAALAHAYALAGQRAQVDKLIAQLHALTTSFNNSYHLATVYAGLGEREAALQELEQSWRARSPILANRALLDPKLDPLRTDPRFQTLLDKMKLAP